MPKVSSNEVRLRIHERIRKRLTGSPARPRLAVFRSNKHIYAQIIDDSKDTVVSINRVTKVVKGGKNLSFSALVVVGDEGGHVGYGNGKAKEVPQAIRKAIEAAKKNLVKVPITNNTIPHQVMGLFGSGRV